MAYKNIDDLRANAAKYGEKELYRYLDTKSGKWVEVSWGSFLKDTEDIASGLIALGVEPGDRIAVCARNNPLLLNIDYAVYMVRGVLVPVNYKEPQTVFDHILDLTEAEVIFVSDKGLLERVLEYVKGRPSAKLKHVVMLKDEKVLDSGPINIIGLADLEAKGRDAEYRKVLEKRISEGVPSDLATIMFVNVAEGMPKGAMIGHDQIEAAIDMHMRFLGDAVEEGQISISYLPLSHIYEKAWLYVCIKTGLRIAFCKDEGKVYEALKGVQPDIVRCVPRFWQEFYKKFVDYYMAQNMWRRQMVKRAFKVGKMRNLYYRRTGRKVPFTVESEYKYWDKHLFSKFRKEIGLASRGIYPTSGSILNDKILGFLLKAGLDIYYGYGLVETTVPVSVFPVLRPVLGTVGKPLEETHIKISNDGEVLLKGPTIMRGYYKDKEATEKAFDKEGYFHTGDMGYLTETGELVINGRLREIYKTSKGKIIPPVFIEKTLMKSPLLQRVLAVADAREYVTALVYPNPDELKRIADERGWKYKDIEELHSLPETKKLLMDEIEKYQGNFADYMRVRNIEIIPRDISRATGEISVTGKVRRLKVRNSFLKQVEKLYPNEYIEAEPLFDLHQPH